VLGGELDWIAFPVTLVVAVLCIGLTMLAGGAVWGTHWAVSWGVHADARHLVHDVGVLVLIGAWIERRTGSGRVGLWLSAGALASHGLHVLCYPWQGPLMGISAATWTLAGAGVVSTIGAVWARWVGVFVLGAVLGVEWFVPWREVLVGVSSFGAASGGAPEYAGVVLHPVPLVHMGCAGFGVVLGLLGRRAGGGLIPTIRTLPDTPFERCRTHVHFKSIRPPWFFRSSCAQDRGAGSAGLH
jgi:hypothetical protein